MSRVSDEHLETRRSQILDAARRCFMRNGFHGTSMHDVIAESGLSTGAVYRYFSGKDELITAIASEGVNALAAAIEPVLAKETLPSLQDVLTVMFERLEQIHQERGLAGLAVQVWAEALQSPQMRLWFGESITRARGWIRDLIVAEQARGTWQASASPEATAQVLATLLPGFLLQLALLDDLDAETFSTGLAGLGFSRHSD
ncbi:MAG: TetR/AcrR family transcriptional regulator [Solirubrobacteraceae bacterium]